jgi:hypothetical protein
MQLDKIMKSMENGKQIAQYYLLLTSFEHAHIAEYENLLRRLTDPFKSYPNCPPT